MLRAIYRSVVPETLRSEVYRARHRALFRKAMRRFLRMAEPHARPDSPLLAQLVQGWNNTGWSGQPDFLAACVAESLSADGPVLECGSGLSTLVIGATARAAGVPVYSLEHHPEWADRVQGELDRFGLDNVTLIRAPLVDFGPFEWYDVNGSDLPESVDLAVCDGPPADVKGGRTGLVPIVADRFASGATILLDDAVRNGELEIGRGWADELGSSCAVEGKTKPYMRLTLPAENGAARAVAHSVITPHDDLSNALRPPT